jgi:hypothetical protein
MPFFLALGHWMGAIPGNVLFGSAVVASLVFRWFGTVK